MEICIFPKVASPQQINPTCNGKCRGLRCFHKDRLNEYNMDLLSGYMLPLFFFSTWCEPHTLETRGNKLYNRVFTRAYVQHRPLDGLVCLNEEDASIQVYEATK